MDSCFKTIYISQWNRCYIMRWSSRGLCRVRFIISVCFTTFVARGQKQKIKFPHLCLNTPNSSLHFVVPHIFSGQFSEIQKLIVIIVEISKVFVLYYPFCRTKFKNTKYSLTLLVKHDVYCFALAIFLSDYILPS